MRLSRLLLLGVLGAITAAGSTITACGSDGDGGGGPNPALFGVWDATSFVAGGVDAIANGMTLLATLRADETYTLDVTNDQIGTCNPGPDCTQTGDYASGSGQITFDPGTQDAVTLSYTIQGTTLTLTGNIDGTAVTVTLEKQ